MSFPRKIRVLVVDDSAIVRKVLTDVLSSQPDIEVVGTAPDPYVARDKIVALQPDVLTLDVEMPRMDGLTFLDRLMAAHPMPVVVISSLTQRSAQAALEAVHRGAVDVMAKPGGPYSVGDLKEQLPGRIRAAAAAKVQRGAAALPSAIKAASSPLAALPHPPQAPPVSRSGDAPHPSNAGSSKGPASGASDPGPWRRDRVILIGASTGGTQAIEQILRNLPAGLPPILATQHIPAGFSAAFAERLNGCCAMRVSEARDGEPAVSGHAYVAPGNWHMLLEQTRDAGYCVRLHDGPKLHYQRPAVDELFSSGARVAGKTAIGVLLTGMGKDGAQGMLSLRTAGAMTIAQDEATCVVFGMPHEAISLGAAQRVLGLNEIAPALLELVRLSPAVTELAGTGARRTGSQS